MRVGSQAGPEGDAGGRTGRTTTLLVLQRSTYPPNKYAISFTAHYIKRIKH